MRNLGIIIILVIILLSCAPFLPSSFAADNITIESYSYDTHWIDGETVTFTVTVKNNESNSVNARILIALTKRGTGAETDIYANFKNNIAAGATYTFTSADNLSWTASTGTYTVTIKSEDGDGLTADTEYGNLPIVVGSSSTKESLSVFPTVLDLGTIPNGRFMYPAPLQISWDFFLYDRLRKSKPWFIRIYTDNSTKFTGIPGAFHSLSPAGLISSDGRYSISLRAWCLNFGPDTEETGWDPNMLGAPPVDDDLFWSGPLLGDGKRLTDKRSWQRVPDYIEMTADNDTWRKLIGEDITDTQSVADNVADGAFTLSNPFSVYLATDATTTAVKGNYTARVIIELYSP